MKTNARPNHPLAAHLRLDLRVYLATFVLFQLFCLGVGVAGAIIVREWYPLALPAASFTSWLGCWIYYRQHPD